MLIDCKKRNKLKMNVTSLIAEIRKGVDPIANMLMLITPNTIYTTI
jgi:hypothetical protein